MAANLPAIYGTLIYMAMEYLFTNCLVRQNTPDDPSIVGGVLLYVLCAILDGYGITMHYMSASVGNLSGASGQHKRFLLGCVFLGFLKNFGKVVLTVVRC